MSSQTFEELTQKILSLPRKHDQKIVAIDGGGGAGKSTFAECLQKLLPNSSVIHVDDFYKGPWDKRLEHTNYVINPLFDWERFNTEVLVPLREGKQVQYHIYDWHTHTSDQIVSVPTDSIIILEGGSTTQTRFSDEYDFKIWIDADESLRLTQALLRDGEHMRFLWEEDWLPVERNYIREDNPASRADLIVRGQSGDFRDGVFEIVE